MVRNRKLSYVLNKDYRPDTINAINITKKKRTKVPCSCNKCEEKLVDPRTKKRHESADNEISSQSPVFFQTYNRFT